jgi:hypothetical protein
MQCGRLVCLYLHVVQLYSKARLPRFWIPDGMVKPFHAGCISGFITEESANHNDHVLIEKIWNRPPYALR